MVEQNEYQEFLQDFLLESTELLEDYEQNLLLVETIIKDGGFTFEQIADHLHALFRSIHTIKSLAAMMNFDDVNRYTHQAEDLLDLVRSNALFFDSNLINLMFDILDTTRKLIENIKAPHTHILDLEAELAKFASFSDTTEETDTIIDSSPTSPAQEDVTQKNESSQSSESPDTPPTSMFSSTTIRIDTCRLDELLDTVGELVIGKNSLIDVTNSLIHRDESFTDEQVVLFDFEERIRSDLMETVDRLTRLIINLQERSMKLRMVPVGYTFQKFQRTVRDLSQKNGKIVRLEIEGETTEVDRAVIEAMTDPLLHIIRNAIDHGIESPSQRKEKGKPVAGTIQLNAYQENNAIVIEVIDDGRGIDPEAVFKKAVDVLLIEPDSQLTQKEILNLIFSPGLSTAEAVTNVSGRGVGMDVVKRNIMKLNGMIDIESKVDDGTKFTLTLPLTLAIIRVLLVEIGGSYYSIPISNVIETLRMPISEICHVNGYEAVQIRETVLPIVHLDQALGVVSNGEKDKLFIVVVGVGERRVGFVVDALVAQQDVVIRPLGEYLEEINIFSGATILGNGEISLVLDLGSLWQEVKRENSSNL